MTFDQWLSEVKDRAEKVIGECSGGEGCEECILEDRTFCFYQKTQMLVAVVEKLKAHAIDMSNCAEFGRGCYDCTMSCALYDLFNELEGMVK